jgi:NodT family efflux transporter outer membrane factor (OMF) lipoprotein
MIRAALALALAGMLCGCAVGPDYRPPTLPAGAVAPLVSVNPAQETVAAPPDDWWRLYEDPRLDAYLREAFAANVNLKVAEANLSGARALLEAARAGSYPQTEVGLGAIYGRDPTTNEVLEIIGAKPQTTWLFDDILDVSYELDLFGRVRRSIQASRADAQAAAAARDALRVTIAAETTRAYAGVCALGEQLTVARHSLEVVSREEEIARQRHLAGANTEFDLVRAEGLVAQVRASIPPLEGQRRSALFELTEILGRTPQHAPTEAEACVQPPRLRSLIPVGDGAALIQRRPDVREADRRLAAATARIGVATADLYPRITLSAFYGGAAASTSNLVAEPGLVWGVGPKIAWTFPNQAGPRAHLRQARAAAAGALAGFDSAVLQALKETEKALVTYGSELDRRQDVALAQDRARRAYEIASGQFRAGALPTLDLLTTEQTLIAADAAVAASDTALVQDQISLFKALGGGWRASSATLPDTSAKGR